MLSNRFYILGSATNDEENYGRAIISGDVTTIAHRPRIPGIKQYAEEVPALLGLLLAMDEHAASRKQVMIMKNDEYYFQEGCFITELHNSPEDPALSVARARVEPGSTTRWHSLTGVHERYLILAGEGRVEIGDDPPRWVQPGEVVLIPPGCRQRITNTGETDLIFLAVCTPRFIPTIYHDQEAA